MGMYAGGFSAMGICSKVDIQQSVINISTNKLK
jgi:hypothetical protein